MRVNFVMSNCVYSGIFTSIITYFKEFKPKDAEIYVTQHPLKNMDIYHYHRPNIEQFLEENSVVTVHHDLEDTDPWFNAQSFISKYHQAKAIICLNAKQSEILKSKENLCNTFIIPHGVNNKVLKANEKKYENRDKITLGIISKRYERRVKGEVLLEELFKRLNPNKIKFIFVGEGRSIDEAKAKTYNFEAISFEELPYSMFNDLYSNIDLLLIPSLYEGGPANLPEALYSKTPVLGRNIAMLSDNIIEGVNGYFLSGLPDKDAELIDSLSRNSKGLFETLLFNINNYSPIIMTWQDVVGAHFELYKNIITENI